MLATFLFGSVDWFVRLYKHHSVTVAQKNLGFLTKLIMCVIGLGYQINVLFVDRRDVWQVFGLYLNIQGAIKLQVMKTKHGGSMLHLELTVYDSSV